MEENIKRENVVSYYNDHIKFKVNDYIIVNPRIEGAWKTIKKFAPKNPVRILEVGCGMGSICNKMHSRWPAAQITGIDISTESIQIAKKLFANKQVNFIESILTPETFTEQFDLIVFMDVYEHIAITDRPTVHAALASILSNKGKIILSVPTPANLRWSLVNKPETMQPVDEHISFEVIGKLKADTSTEVILYELKNIWNVGDYAHIVLEKNNDFEAAFFTPKPVTALQRSNRILNKIKYKMGSYFRKAYVRGRLK